MTWRRSASSRGDAFGIYDADGECVTPPGSYTERMPATDAAKFASASGTTCGELTMVGSADQQIDTHGPARQGAGA